MLTGHLIPQERDASSRFGPNAQFYPCNVSGRQHVDPSLWLTVQRPRGVPCFVRQICFSALTFKPCIDPKSCLNAVEACITKFGRLDILFHNGARLSPITTVADHSIEVFQDVIHTNLCGAFYLAKAVIPHMRKQKKGVIINTASISGIRGDYGMASYNAAKAGLVNLTRTMAIDHAREGIRVVSVCPGFMATPMTHGVVTGNAELEADLFESIPMGRGGDPKEIARAVLFLASDDASYITGHRKKLIIDQLDLRC